MSSVRIIQNWLSKLVILIINYDTNDFTDAIRNMKLILDCVQVTLKFSFVYIRGSSIFSPAIRSM